MQKTAYEMRISDWSSDVCSSDLAPATVRADGLTCRRLGRCGRGGLLPGRGVRPGERRPGRGQIGRASCRERVCQYVSISVVAVYLKNKTDNDNNIAQACK